MLHQHSLTHKGLTGLSAALLQYSWTKKWTDWFKWSFTSVFQNTKWTERFKWRITSIFLNIQWTVKVTDHVNIPEKKDWFKWPITPLFTVVTRDRMVSGATHFRLLNKQWCNFLWDAKIHVSYYLYQNLPWNSSLYFRLCIFTFILLTSVNNALHFKLKTWFKQR